MRFACNARGVAPKLAKLLTALDMSADPVTCPGLVRADQELLDAKKRSKAPLEEIVALERATHFGADYVYFRRFTERPAMATVYIYDWTERLGEAQQPRSKFKGALPNKLREELAELHRRFWSACEIPLVYVFLPTEVQVYHILQGPEEGEHGIEPSPWKIIEFTGEVAEALQSLKALSARRLDDGRFWEEDPDARELRLEGAAFMALSQEIGSCRAELVLKHGLDDGLVRRLLILFVMIKYLEERTDRHGQGVFPPNTFSVFAAGANGFVDLLRAGGLAVLAFLNHLATKDRFNGEVFRLEAGERDALREANLEPFADLLDARIEGSQRTFWRRYAFRELPVELISHLYEQFLPRQPGVVYTPPFLVNFILDDVLPLSQETPKSFRLIDPACGSGIFLVGAFKRLVHRWRRDNDFRAPDVETLKRLLREHIFGVDCEGEAVRLTVFSLSVALCDFLEPRVIWDQLHFDSLEDANLLQGDFFAQVRQRRWGRAGGFDLVVGNPPFVSELTPAGAAELADFQRSEPGFDLPDNQAALLFLKSATRIAKPGGRIALIQPSGPLLYGENSSRFRKPFLEKVFVPQIVDFTHMSRVLFKRQRIRSVTDEGNDGSSNPGDVAVAVVFAENCAPLDVPLLHVTVRRTVQAEQKLMFEIDHYDLHFIPRQEAIANTRVWKANFIGGGRISHLSRRLAQLQNLGAFLKKKVEQGRWDAGEGYIAGSEKKIRRLEALLAKQQEKLTAAERAELDALEKRHRIAPWLTGHRMMPTKAFTSDGIDWNQVKTIEQTFFTEPRRKSLFTGPLLLIKEVVEANTEKLPVALLTEGIRYKAQIFGIHAPKTDLAHLKRIQKTLEDARLVRFWLLADSGRYLVNKSSAILKADILKLPFPDSPDELRLSPIEEVLIDDVLEHVADSKRKGERAAIHQRPSKEHLRQFGDFFCRVLGSVYGSLRAAEPVVLREGICYPFYFGEAPSRSLEPGAAGAASLEKLLSTTVGSNLRCQRILRVFSGNMLLLVKPAQLRYWLRSIAVRDADEVFAELRGRGY